MAAPRLSWILISLAGLGFAGCRGTPHPVTRTDAPTAPKAPAAAPSQAPEPSAAAPTPEPPQEAPARANPAVVVDPGIDGDGTPATLVEAARAEKERRSRTGQSSVVINDKNLPRYASKGQITVADPKKKKGSVALAAPPAAPAPAVRDEAYWRDRARNIRERWHQTAEDVKKLEQRSTELRQKFYLENDTFLRDSRIKPEWDRVLDLLRQAKADEETVKQELDTFLEEGRTAGATPAWLNEGEEEEPQSQNGGRPSPRKKDAMPPARSIEPPLFDRGKDNRDRTDTPPPLEI